MPDLAAAKRSKARIGTSEQGGAAARPDLTDRGRPGSKRHIAVHATGTPRGVTIGPANQHDNRAPTPDAIPPLRNARHGRPRRQPNDRTPCNGCDDPHCRQARPPGLTASAPEHALRAPRRHRPGRRHLRLRARPPQPDQAVLSGALSVPSAAGAVSFPGEPCVDHERTPRARR